MLARIQPQTPLFATSRSNRLLLSHNTSHIKAIETKKWDVDTNGPLTAQNIMEFYDKRGFATSDAIYDPGHHFNTHSHFDESFVVVLSGQYTVDFKHEQVELGPGEMCEIPIGVPHEEYTTKESQTHAVFGTKALALGTALRLYRIWRTFTSLFKN